MENFKLSWKNLFGHAATVDQLKKNIAARNFPHAVIFSGVEGIGKKLAAEICAAALLCENPVDGEPCGTCASCHLVAAHTHIDFVIVEPEETKAARNIKIGQIRDLQEKTAMTTMISEQRIVIIDGAEFMNVAAANCLLKTIEEPPGPTIFILLTANQASLLMTIRSRCRIVNFDKLSTEEIFKGLIARGVDEEQAKTLSVVADGSFGRALSLKNSGAAERREFALSTLEKLCRKEFTDEDIFQFGANVDGWSRDEFADFLTHVQKILRDVSFAEVLPPLNPDLLPRLQELKISEQKIFSLTETGVTFHKRLKSNAQLRLLAEAYLFHLKKILSP